MKVYGVIIQSDYESTSTYGYFSSKELAEKHKKALEENEYELGILDGVYIEEEELDNPTWNIFSPEEEE